MWQLLQIELFKISKRPRTYISFGFITALVLFVQLGLKFDGLSYIEFVMGSLKDSLDIPYQNILNGYFVCFVILNLLLIHIPLLVALIAGDAIAGEANMGTLRLIAAKPVSRTSLILAKFFASVIYTASLLLWMAVLALVFSIFLFGVNDIVVARSNTVEQIQSADILWRYVAAFGFAAVALSTVAALALLLSVFAENAIGPIVATMGIVVILTVLSELQIPVYDRVLKPYLFTSHMLAWKGFFYLKATPDNQSIPGSIENLPAILRSLAILLLYMVVLVGSAIFVFRKKDILS
jgi:ABC-2 type transport system permease protein